MPTHQYLLQYPTQPRLNAPFTFWLQKQCSNIAKALSHPPTPGGPEIRFVLRSAHDGPATDLQIGPAIRACKSQLFGAQKQIKGRAGLPLRDSVTPLHALIDDYVVGMAEERDADGLFEPKRLSFASAFARARQPATEGIYPPPLPPP